MASIVAAWPTVALGKVLRKSDEWIDIRADTEYMQVTVRLWGKGAALRGRVPGSQIAASRQIVVRANQFILSRIDARNGAFGLVTTELDGAVVSNDFPVFNLDETRIMPAYLGWLSKTHDFVEMCQRASEGTTNRVRLKEDQFLVASIPLPPLDEQRRIVARIEALAGRIAEARGLRAAALAEGNVVLATSLKRTRIELLLHGYPVQRLGEISRVTAGGTPSRDVTRYWGGNIPWIKTGELLDADIYRAEECITEEGLCNSSARVFPVDTVLVALYGQGQTRGRTGRLCIPSATNQACCAILPTPSLLESRFLQYWLRSLYFEMREDSHGGAQPNWNGQMVKEIEVALPTLGKQRQIVMHLDDMQARADELRRLQSESQAELDALLPSLLDKAFRGEL